MTSIVARLATSRRLSLSQEDRSHGDQRLSFVERAVASVSLSLLFVLVYGGSNLVASRMHTGSWFYSWELRIPFLPLLIVPYMSIDLFFFTSFFLCAERTELHAHCRRIAMAILVAGVCFILFPLSTAYPIPMVDGWTGDLFRFLWSFDRPHNLVPSLHVALLSLLWPLYVRHTPGIRRVFVHVWFGLIVLSPLFTWQHHVVDVLSGALLGQLCIFSFPVGRTRVLMRSASGNLRVAIIYACGSAAFFVMALVLGGWWWLSMWPSISLGLIATAYLRGDSSIFRKTGGGLPISTRIVLGPYLLGVFVRVLIYKPGRQPWIEMGPGLFYGRLLTQREALRIRSMGISAVLDLTAEHSTPRAFRDIEYLNVPVLDLTRSSEEQLAAASMFIDQQINRGSVYVHCALGVSRSAAVAEHYLRWEKDEIGPMRTIGPIPR